MTEQMPKVIYAWLSQEWWHSSAGNHTEKYHHDDVFQDLKNKNDHYLMRIKEEVDDNKNKDAQIDGLINIINNIIYACENLHDFGDIQRIAEEAQDIVSVGPRPEPATNNKEIIDMIEFKGQLYIATKSAIYRKDIRGNLIPLDIVWKETIDE